MFNIETYPEIIMHLKLISTRFHKHTSGWIEIFCPFCNDATRKYNPRHGHLHIAPNFPFAHCWRCSTKVGLHQLLLYTGFQDIELIKKLQKSSGVVYSSSKKIKVRKSDNNLPKKILEHYDKFFHSYPDWFEYFLEYIEYRCCEINPAEFQLLPIFDQNNQFGVQILNFDGNLVTTRLTNSKKRYINPSVKSYYYFQNIIDIDNYNNIIIAEGAFDIINTYNYLTQFNRNKSFYLSIGGSSYKATVTDLINSFLLLGHYSFHIIFDSNVQYLPSVLNSIKQSGNILNPDIEFNFYIPVLSKDVGECSLIQKII